MKFIKADFKDVEVIHSIVHSTIKEVYPKYYPEGVVDFFLTHHSLENIKKAVNIEFILLIECDGEIVGTGAIYENQIKRMFVLPEFQGKGYGSMLLDRLEQQAANKGYANVVLDSSLPAYSLYEKRGYVPIEYKKIVTKNRTCSLFSQNVKNACKGRKIKRRSIRKKFLIIL